MGIFLSPRLSPRGDALARFWGGRRPRPLARPAGPGVAAGSRGDKEPPVTLGVCRDRTKPGPGIPPPACPVLSPSPPFILSFLPRGWECEIPASASLDSLQVTVRGSPNQSCSPGRSRLCRAQRVSVSSWISQPAMELRCYLSQDTRSPCDCLNPITVLKIGIRDKYCELQRKEPAV